MVGGVSVLRVYSNHCQYVIQIFFCRFWLCLFHCFSFRNFSLKMLELGLAVRQVWLQEQWLLDVSAVKDGCH